jgi:acetyl esterase/lipase
MTLLQPSGGPENGTPLICVIAARTPNDEHAVMSSDPHFAPEAGASQLSEIRPASASVLNIHPDFKSIKGHGLSVDGWSVVFKSRFLRAVNIFHRRKFRRWTSEIDIPGPDGNPLSLVIIRPDGLPARSPVLVYYHGGTSVRTPQPQHLTNAVCYGLESPCVVIFAQYRRASESSFPAAFNDCYAVLRWVISNPDHLRIDRARIAIGGDSAGAALAAAVTQKAVHEHQIELCAQVLIYPTADARRKTQLPVAAASVLPARVASPPAAKLRGLPPTYVELAEFDVMRDEGKAHAEAMRGSGVEVELNEVSGAIHGFDLLVPESDISKAALDRRIQFLRRIFAGPTCPTFRTRRTLASQSLAQRQADLKSAHTPTRSQGQQV